MSFGSLIEQGLLLFVFGGLGVYATIGGIVAGDAGVALVGIIALIITASVLKKMRASDSLDDRLHRKMEQ